MMIEIWFVGMAMVILFLKYVDSGVFCRDSGLSIVF